MQWCVLQGWQVFTTSQKTAKDGMLKKNNVKSWLVLLSRISYSVTLATFKRKGLSDTYVLSFALIHIYFNVFVYHAGLPVMRYI